MSQLAATHFPELSREPLVRLGAAEGPAFQKVLVERRVQSYNGPGGREALEELANHFTARHRVFRRHSWHVTRVPPQRSVAAQLHAYPALTPTIRV